MSTATPRIMVTTSQALKAGMRLHETFPSMAVALLTIRVVFLFRGDAVSCSDTQSVNHRWYRKVSVTIVAIQLDGLATDGTE